MSQWFYLRQWQQKAWERLLEHRTVRVSWDTGEEDQRETMPQFVRIPAGIELTNEGISNYLSDTFGWCVSNWVVAHREQYESRV